MKICSRCKIEKDESEFYYSNINKDRLSSYCKECKNIGNKKDKHKRTLREYGLTEVDYELMLKSQNGVCAICNQVETAKYLDTIKCLAIDHCHKPFKIRGLLCANCNRMLGLAKENIETLQQAVEYLEKHK